MTILGLIVCLVVVCIALWVARQIPAPFSFILYAVIVCVVLIVLLEVTGVLGTGVLGRRV